MSLIIEGNRLKHVFYASIMSLALGWAAGIASIVSLEYKDVQRGGWTCWDWLDCAAGLIGCVIGGAVHFAIFKHW